MKKKIRDLAPSDQLLRAAPGSLSLRNCDRRKPWSLVRTHTPVVTGGASGFDGHILEGQSVEWTVTRKMSGQVLLRTGCGRRSRARTTMLREESRRSLRHRQFQESTPAMVTRLSLSLFRPWPPGAEVPFVQRELSLCL